MNFPATVTAAKGLTITCRVFDPATRTWYDAPGWTATEASADLTTLTATALNSATENRYSGTVAVPDGGNYVVEYLDGSDILAEEAVDYRLQYLTGDSYARLGAPAGASIAADIATKAPSATALSNAVWTNAAAAYLDAAISSRASQTSVNTIDDFLDTEMAQVLAAVDTEVAAITTTLGAAGAGLTGIPNSAGVTTLLSRIVGTLAAGTHTAQTGDSFARLGAPAGASVSADVAAVKAETATIVADTGTDGVVVAAGSKTGYALTADYDPAKTALTTATTAADGDTLTANSILEILRRLRWILQNRLEIDDATGAIVVRKDDGTTQALAGGTVTDNSTTTVRTRVG
jgi:hypothetical protein